MIRRRRRPRATDFPERLVKVSLAPARILHVDLDVVQHRAVGHLPADQLDLVRADDDLNLRLASELTGWPIEIVVDDTG